jgi:hypothetical protein
MGPTANCRNHPLEQVPLKRWKVERTFAWLLSDRRTGVRWERHVGVHRGSVLIVMALICINRLLESVLELRAVFLAVLQWCFFTQPFKRHISRFQMIRYA